MKVQVEEINPVKKRISVELPPETVKKTLDRIYADINKEVRISGFRQGKAPRHLLERYYSETAKNDAIRDLIKDSLHEAIKETGFELILDPSIEDISSFSANEPFSYKAILELWPQFELPEYKGIELTRPNVTVTEEEVDEQLEALRRHWGVMEIVEDEDRAVVEGDIVTVDYTAYHNDEPIEGVSDRDYFIEVGKGYFHEEIERQLIGMKKNEIRDIEVTYPEDAVNDHLAGKTVRYRTTLKTIQQRVLPELNDEFAQKINPVYKTIEDIRDRLRTQIEIDKRNAVERSLREQLMASLLSKVDFPVPDGLVERKLESMLNNIASYLSERGVDMQKAGLSEEKLKAKMRDDAIAQVKTELILEKIASKENIEVEESEIRNYINSMNTKGLDEQTLYNAIVQHVIPSMKAQKTIDFLMKNAVIQEVA